MGYIIERQTWKILMTSQGNKHTDTRTHTHTHEDLLVTYNDIISAVKCSTDLRKSFNVGMIVNQLSDDSGATPLASHM